MIINARFVATALAVCLTGTFAAPRFVQPSNGTESASDAIQPTTFGSVSTSAPSQASTDVVSATNDITQTVGLNTTSTSSTIALPMATQDTPVNSTIGVPMETTSVVSTHISSSTAAANILSTTVSVTSPAATPSSTSTNDISSSADVSQSTGLSASGLTSSASSAFATPTSVADSDTYNSTTAVPPSATDASQDAVPSPPWPPFHIPMRGNASIEGPTFKGPIRPDCLEHPGPREEALINTVGPSSSTGSEVPTSSTTASTDLPSVTSVPQPVPTTVGQCLALRSACLPYWIAGSVPCCEGTVCFPVVFGLRGYCVTV